MIVERVDFGGRTVELRRKQSDVLERIQELKVARDRVLPDMHRTAQVLDGGEHAVQALTGGRDPGDEFRDLPIANYLKDALEALAGRMGALPELRVDPPSRGRRNEDQSDTALKTAEKIARIVANYDRANRLRLAMPQVARWLPGASYTVATIDPVMEHGHPYPRATFHYPLETLLAQWSPIKDPADCGLVQNIPLRELKRFYPWAADRFVERQDGGILLGGQMSHDRGVEVVRYYDDNGTWWFAPDHKMLLDFAPTPDGFDGPAFQAFSKYNYSRLRGEFDDLIGLMVSMARLNILAEIAVKDNVFAPTNIFGGHPLTGPYKKGRGINIFDANVQVDIPQRGTQFEAWQQIDRLERQLNIEATMPQQDRGESPMSFVTGRGLQHLAGRVERQVSEYQTVMSEGLMGLDSKLLAYDESAWPDVTKPMRGSRDGIRYEETYRPARDIAGRHHTTREYGVMAGVEEATKMNGLAIMDSAGWVSKRWVRSQIQGLGNSVEIEAQLRTEGAEAAFMQLLMTHASEPESPEHMRALEAIVEMLPPGEMQTIAEKWFTDRGEELSQEEEQMVGGPLGAPEEPPNPTAVLSRLTAGGEARGGVQTLGRL